MKKIWFVEWEDLSCCWTKKADAIAYLFEELKRTKLDYKIISSQESLNADNEDYIKIQLDYKTIYVFPVMLDEKPYWD